MKQVSKHVRQEAGVAVKFALVGGAATATHAVVALGLLTCDLAPPFLSNIGGFLVAFAVSFIGHHFWSFSHTRDDAMAAQRMKRFFVIALAGFLINSGALLAWLDLTSWPDWVGILFAIAIVPVFTFGGARLWAFSNPARPIGQNPTE